MMAEFASLEDWGLQAIVRGSTAMAGDYCNTSNNPNSCYGLMDNYIPKDDDIIDHDILFNFPSLFERAAILTDELQELCKPFHNISHSSSPAQDSSTGGSIVASDSISVCKEMKEELPEEEDKSASIGAIPYMPKYKRRKNQHKRVVLQVTAEDLSNDMWAWRKYGQKPIKGSPYPRSYYRCSSSKGCLARKQVEQNCNDPSIFIITYTAEHNHSQPTRKNALAGTTRHKFSSLKTSPPRTSPRAAKKKDSVKCSPSPSSAVSLSPETPFLAEEDQFPGTILGDDSHNNGAFFPEVMLDDDLFSGFGDWDGFMSGLMVDDHCSTQTVSSRTHDR
ncbi:hypothetical protein ACH5RR_041638 [Cinchona calisaya]|uniref:WRKY domain-containing protein n=1 Tax=Cinchona calisaya TaxID=153742 RepID=A0ABD2XU52_9GENT